MIVLQITGFGGDHEFKGRMTEDGVIGPGISQMEADVHRKERKSGISGCGQIAENVRRLSRRTKEFPQTTPSRQTFRVKSSSFLVKWELDGLLGELVGFGVYEELGLDSKKRKC